MVKHYFPDKYHIVMDEYYDFIDAPQENPPDAVERKMKVEVDKRFQRQKVNL